MNVPFLASALTFDALLAGVPFVLLLLVGLSLVVHGTDVPPDLGPILERFIPPSRADSDNDVSAFAATFIRAVAANRGAISIYATMLFVWFSTRLFASIRTALNRIYHLAAPKHKDRHFLVRMVLNKGWDVVMVGMLLSLFLANLLVSAALAAAEAWSAERYSSVSVGYAGRFLNITLGFVFALTVLTVVYRYASSRPVRWRTAMLAAAFAGLGIEVAKRIFGYYFTSTTGSRGLQGWGSFTTLSIAVLWAYYVALVFLLGGVVAETWAERGFLKESGT